MALMALVALAALEALAARRACLYPLRPCSGTCLARG